MKIKCKFCNSSHLIKKGKSKTKSDIKQIYLCKDCYKKFTFSSAPNKTYPIRIIVEAISNYNLGHTLKNSVALINKKYKIKISVSTLHEWLKEYKEFIPYLQQRSNYTKKYDIKKLITRKTFEHNGLHYYFRFHNAKLDSLCSKYNLESLKKYIPNLLNGCPPFFGKNKRCSQLEVDIESDVKQLNNLACKMARLAIKTVSQNKERHKALESFMLLNDTKTIAVEVPVWFWEKTINDGVSGHIDILQIKNDKIYILDYKPQAIKDKKAMGQLYLYTQALTHRLGLKLKDFRCAWFDENNYFEFDPALAKYRGVQV